jgi:hypothetical protein
MISELAVIGAFCLAASMAVGTVWSRKETRVRGLAVAGFALMIPFLVASSYFARSWPLPLNEWTAPEGRVRVIAANMRQDVAIWLWLDSETGPRYYVRPWNNEEARTLQGMMDGQAESGQSFFIWMDKDTSEAKFDTVQIPPALPKRDPSPTPVYPQHQ